MKNLKQELEALSTSLNELKEAMNLSLNLMNSRIEDALKEADAEPKEYELIPFDIEKAKQGAKVMTRDGHDVRILCYDSKNNRNQPIVAEVYVTVEDSTITNHAENGTYLYDGATSDYDLFIAEEKCV